MIEESSNEAQFNVIRLSDDYPLQNMEFDCDDPDLNEFLLLDSLPYQVQLLTVTYIIEDENKCLVGFFSVLNDKLTTEEVKIGRTQFRKRIPNLKRYKSYPCVKIGRLAVHKNYKGKNIGTTILDYIKVLFYTKNKTGCRFITVDAYAKSADFYKKNDFNFLTDEDKDAPTRQMYFDLIRLSKIQL